MLHVIKEYFSKGYFDVEEILNRDLHDLIF